MAHLKVWVFSPQKCMDFIANFFIETYKYEEDLKLGTKVDCFGRGFQLISEMREHMYAKFKPPASFCIL